ncbi:MAG: ABC transporter ATP-binding protein [Lachnospiraceae bacterium]|nr:ABC transporter ATP-binding protein [Lachnospiraceae bacterium]
MIEVTNIQKSFEEIKAIDHITARIEEGHVFGLIGTNGAGKSTFLRMLCGVLKADSGQVLVDGETVYNNPAVKGKFFYISDDMYFFKNGTPRDMARLYQTYYPGFDWERYEEMLEKFGLKAGRKIDTFSKGMKKQLAVICGICAGTKYLLCDETFDGLDPVMRQAVKVLFAKEMEDRGLTPIIASHNLRELEDICEYVGLLHKGGILFARDLDDMKLNLHKVQCVVKNQATLEHIRNNLEVVTMDQRGTLYTFTIRGTREQLVEYMELLNPVFYELLPLSLEEIFISETEVNGYDIKALIS